MTSLSVIDEVAATYGMSKVNAKEYAKMFEEVIYKMLEHGEEFKFADINFTIKDVAPHKGRNPFTGEVVDLPATKRLALKPSANLKATVKSK